jgi:hypothetical protein
MVGSVVSGAATYRAFTGTTLERHADRQERSIFL